MLFKKPKKKKKKGKEETKKVYSIIMSGVVCRH